MVPGNSLTEGQKNGYGVSCLVSCSPFLRQILDNECRARARFLFVFCLKPEKFVEKKNLTSGAERTAHLDQRDLQTKIMTNKSNTSHTRLVATLFAASTATAVLVHRVMMYT